MRPLEPRVLNAGNAGAFTLDGTRTFLVGRRQVAVIDPGPEADAHLRALLRALRGAERVEVLLTHGHADHAAGAAPLARAGGFPVRAAGRIGGGEGDEGGGGDEAGGGDEGGGGDQGGGSDKGGEGGEGGGGDESRGGGEAGGADEAGGGGEAGGAARDEPGAAPVRNGPGAAGSGARGGADATRDHGVIRLSDGDTFDTDQGELVALHTPGHSRDHFALHWPPARTLFAGDLLLGEGATTWVGEYPGCVADYLASLERVRALDLAVIFPAHGPPIRNVRETLDAYEAHRRARIRQVEEAMEGVEAAGGRADAGEVARRIYGEALPPELAEAARRSVAMTMVHLRPS